MKKFLIVQPHSDDALFSNAHLFLDCQNRVEILTIENDKKRNLEDRKLYDLLGIKVHNLDIKFLDDSYYTFFKTYRELNPELALKFLDEYYGKEKMKEISVKTKEFIKNYDTKHSGYKVVAPLGIAHPFHYFVHDVLLKRADLFYREFPHSYKKRAKNQMEQVVQNFTLFEKHEMPKEVHDLKFELAKKFYKTQSGLLFFEQGYINKRLPEELYKKI